MKPRRAVLNLGTLSPQKLPCDLAMGSQLQQWDTFRRYDHGVTLCQGVRLARTLYSEHSMAAEGYWVEWERAKGELVLVVSLINKYSLL